jgi:hypothetical protein
VFYVRSDVAILQSIFCVHFPFQLKKNFLHVRFEDENRFFLDSIEYALAIKKVFVQIKVYIYNFDCKRAHESSRVSKSHLEGITVTNCHIQHVCDERN